MTVVALIESNEIPTDLAAKVSPGTLAMMIDGASSAAYRAAPCLKGNPTDDQLAEARLIVLSAISRWLTDGSGMSGRSEGAGPFTTSTTPPPQRSSGYRLWPSEISDLQAICKSGRGIGSIGTCRGDHIPSVRLPRGWPDAGPLD